MDLSGGPGEAGTDDAFDISNLKRVRAQHALLFADIRGTGNSNGLFCEPALASAAQPQTLFDEDFFPLRNVDACRRHLQKRADLTQYTTNNAVDDLEDLRQALGFRTVTLRGGSYGTEAAQVYLRRHPRAVRATLLTSVVSMNFRLPLPFARAAQSAIEGVFRECHADEKCRHTFPNPAADLASIRSRLEGRPAVILIQPHRHAKGMAIRLGPAMFAERVRNMLYDPALSRKIPLLLHAAARGNFQPLGQSLYEIGAAFQDPSFAGGLYLSMTCAEDVAFIREQEIAPETSGTFAADTRVRAQQRICRHWHYATVNRSFMQPVHSSVPALLISGANDPATPPWAGRQVLRGFPRGRQIVIPTGTHFAGGPCYDEMQQTFLLGANPWAVNTSCIGGINRLAFPTALDKV